MQYGQTAQANVTGHKARAGREESVRDGGTASSICGLSLQWSPRHMTNKCC